jgi:iron complex outermembrane recepter protein
LSNLIKQRQKRAQKNVMVSHIAKGVGTTAMLSLVVAINAAYAQEATKQDAVIVTGIRKGIEDAISVKKDSTSIVESISAEDIGKLPDVSIAESIARLPGLAAQRVAGRAQVISVRGLSPDFATTLLNGREQVSTGDNRGVEFDQYPSELLSGVTVYKTPDASLVGQGLSGTIDMQTVKPLSFGSRQVALNLRGERNSLGNGVDNKATGNRFSATYIDQFANRTVGLAVGYSHLESPILQEEFGTYGYGTNKRTGVAPGVTVTDGLKTYARSGKNTRDGVMGVLQFKISDSWTSIVDAYYSKFKRVETARGIETNLNNYNGTGDPPAIPLNNTSTQIVNNTLVGSTVSGVYPLDRGLYNKREDILTALGWSNKLKLGSWTLLGDLSFSKASRKELNLETNAQYVDAAGNPVYDTVTFNLNTASFPTTSYGLNYADPTRIRIGQSIYGAGYGKSPKVDDELKSVKLQANTGLGGILPEAFTDIDFGFNYADRAKKKRQPEAGLSTAAPSFVGAAQQYGSANLGFAGAPNALTWSVPGIIASNYDPYLPIDTKSYLVQKEWDLNEKITTGFFKLNFDNQSGSVGLRGNVGVQIQHTDQSSTAKFWDNSVDKNASDAAHVKPIKDGKTFNDVLPSVNFAYSFPLDQTLRIAVAKQVARARLDELKAAYEFSVDATSGKPSIDGGNPKLDPWRATAFDISYEKYFAKKGYVAIAAFHKDIDTYIFKQTVDGVDLSRYVPAGAVDANTGRTVLTTGKVTLPLNGKGGSLSGLELSVSVPFGLFSPTLEGFGATASYTQTASEISIDNTNLGSKIGLPGLSKQVSNITLYYERYGFSGRVSQRQRSDFIGEITGFGADRELRYVKGEKIVDLQLGYEFNEGALKGLGLLLQANNLTNSVYQTYQVTKDRPVEYQRYGKTILFGANYKF